MFARGSLIIIWPYGQKRDVTGGCACCGGCHVGWCAARLTTSDRIEDQFDTCGSFLLFPEHFECRAAMKRNQIAREARCVSSAAAVHYLRGEGEARSST